MTSPTATPHRTEEHEQTGPEMYAITFPDTLTPDITSITMTNITDTADFTTGLLSGTDDNLDTGALDWSTARCRDGNGTLTHLFFSDEAIDTARAKAICGKCPLSVACLEEALDRAEPWGVWGGELLEGGRIVVNKRPRGRPPKHPRPLVVINEDAIAVPVRVA